MGRIADRFNLEKQFVFYASYHDNSINQYLHFACIWPILITAFMLVAHTAPFLEQPDFFKSLPFGEYMILNYTAPFCLVYMTWYICLDFWVGSLGAALVFATYIFSNYFALAAPILYGVPAWKIALPIHITAWIIQFIGHGVFERRKPALLDSFDQAVVTAPMFVLLEIAFPLGYKPQLFARAMKQVKINVKNFQAGKAM